MFWRFNTNERIDTHKRLDALTDECIVFAYKQYLSSPVVSNTLRDLWLSALVINEKDTTFLSCGDRGYDTRTVLNKDLEMIIGVLSIIPDYVLQHSSYQSILPEWYYIDVIHWMKIKLDLCKKTEYGSEIIKRFDWYWQLCKYLKGNIKFTT